jgi:hypothetical protein
MLNRLRTGSRLLLPVAMILIFTERPAHAYLDAGVGSLMVQLFLAGTAGLAVLFRMGWSRIAKIFTFNRRKEKPSKPRADEAA